MGILLFNLCGYLLFYAYLEERFRHQLLLRLDVNNYDETALICKKVPAEHHVYYHHSIRFERYSGKIEICGETYTYVKCRLYNDSIEIVCITKQRAIELQRTKNDFFKLVNDLKTSGKDKKSDTYSCKTLFGDFFTKQEPYQLKNPVYHFKKNIFYDATIIPVHSIFNNEHPPERIA